MYKLVNGKGKSVSSQRFNSLEEAKRGALIEAESAVLLSGGNPYLEFDEETQSVDWGFGIIRVVPCD